MKQKDFIDSHETLISQTEDSLHDIYFFLNTLNATSKKNKFTILKEFIRSYAFGKVTDEAGEKLQQAVVWIQDVLSSN